MRNLRWTDCAHYLLDAILDIPLDETKRNAVLNILAEQEATAAGQTIPSYRIPLLWEALFLKIRQAISMDSTDDATEHSSGPEEVSSGSERVVPNPPTKVVARQSKPRRSKSDGRAVTKQQ